jgi:hypothetical protein
MHVPIRRDPDVLALARLSSKQVHKVAAHSAPWAAQHRVTPSRLLPLDHPTVAQKILQH